ncbi:hypothetical protein PTSG_05739 [Salpingoeca rosetta]|uniref:Uncharacterized protein n=1 Tax=Salpingoeca rosetta (strain ATCC 50818 / BSB-021) TaxID=946362 RepID=F2UB33_SALR5|nr:uncharacterized protein PTSG_05739 [Salpingoeca rosetta]EGD74046.1 hypothetical protein PTSG_05739 [Salpingoeca rosetta]|eukprot:XP_004993608.1 hypothetical protein PTSG_05739 [Salpingoeca rosetta]
MLSSSDHGPDKHQHQHAPTSGAAQHGAANSGSVSPLLDRPHLQLDRAIAALLVRAGFDSTSNQWRDLLLLPQRPPNQSMRSTSAPGDQIAGVQAHGGAPSGMLGRAHTSHNGHGSQASLGAHEKDTSSSTDTVDGNEPPCKRRATVDKGNFCSQHQMDETGDNDEAEAKPGGDDGGADDAAMTAPQEPVAVLRANLMHHIFAWATKAKKHSELCGRYQPNVMDWAQALHEHGNPLPQRESEIPARSGE